MQCKDTIKIMWLDIVTNNNQWLKLEIPLKIVCFPICRDGSVSLDQQEHGRGCPLLIGAPCFGDGFHQ